MESKPTVQSKTIITNGMVIALIPIFEAFGIKIDQNIILAIVPMANIILRFFTDKPLKWWK